MWYDELVPLLPVTVAVIFLCVFAFFGTRDDHVDKRRDRRQAWRRTKRP